MHQTRTATGSAAALRIRTRASTAQTMLALSLAARGAINAGFAVWIWNSRPAWTDFFQGAATYTFADGVVAFAMATLLFRNPFGVMPYLLAAATAGDGLVRIAAAVALWSFPGLPDFPVTAVAFAGSLGACAACLAVVAITIRLATWKAQWRTHRAPSLQLHEVLDPLFVAGVAALGLVVYALIAGPPVSLADYRSTSSRWSFVLGLSFVIAAAGVGTARPRVSRSAAGAAEDL